MTDGTVRQPAHDPQELNKLLVSRERAGTLMEWERHLSRKPFSIPVTSRWY